ncbi:MAG: YqjK family protein [Rhodoferax sp.]
MSSKETELRLRQERVLRRSAQLRNEVVQQSAVLSAPMAQVDRVKRGVSWLRRHPVYMAALVAAMVALKPRNAMSKIGRAWTLWTLLGRFLR